MQRSIKLFFFCFILMYAASNFAFGKGPYIGLQLGETSNHYSRGMLGLTKSQVHYQGFSGRAFLGWQLNSVIGLETGFVRFYPARIQKINGTSSDGTIKDFSVDLLLVGNFPFHDGYYIFGKFGVGNHFAYPSSTIRHFSISDYQSSVHHFRPVGILGIGYAMTQKISIEGSYLEVYKQRNMPKGTLWSLGLTYHFYAC